MILRVKRSGTLLNRVLGEESLLVLSCTFMIKRCLFVYFYDYVVLLSQTQIICMENIPLIQPAFVSKF